MAKSLPTNQFPFVPQLKVANGTTYYLGVQLALTAPQSEGVQIETGRASYYSNNTVNAVFANKSGQSFSLVYLPTPTPTPTPTPSP